MTVLITTPSFGQHSERPWLALTEESLDSRRPRAAHPLSAAELAGEIGDAEGLIVGLDDVSAQALDAAPKLRVVAKHGVGVDNIDTVAAAERGIRVVNVPGANTGAVADLTMALLLAGLRGVVPAHRSVVDGGWDRFFGPELGGRTMGILGFGRIGQAVARRALGFGMTVLAYDPYLPEPVFAEHGATAAGLAECVASVDVLTLHLPLPPDGKPLLGRAELATTKPGAFVVNTARGGLVDEEALAELLHQGRLSGAAVDVYSSDASSIEWSLTTAHWQTITSWPPPGRVR